MSFHSTLAFSFVVNEGQRRRSIERVHTVFGKGAAFAGDGAGFAGLAFAAFLSAFLSDFAIVHKS